MTNYCLRKKSFLSSSYSKFDKVCVVVKILLNTNGNINDYIISNKLYTKFNTYTYCRNND